MKIFTPTRKTKTGAFILFVILLGCTGWLTYFLIPLFGEAGSGFGDEFLLSAVIGVAIGLLLLVFLACFILTIWALVYFNAVRKARLIFDDRTITFEFNPRLPSYRNRGLKPFSIPYDQVQDIKLSEAASVLEIYDSQNNKFLLVPTMFGANYGENVLAELHNHFPAQKIQSGADIVTTQKLLLKKQRKASIPYLIVMILFFITFLFDPMMSSRPWIPAWKVEFNPPGTESVWGYAPDAQNGFWVVGWHINYYRIYHFPNENNREWKLPDSILGDEYPHVASQDQTGNPIVWSTRDVFHYTNGNWETIPFQNNLSYNGWQEDGGVRGEYAWGVKSGQFIKVEALTGAWSVIPLPNSATKLNLAPASMRRNIWGDFLVLMKNEFASRVYIYKGEQWATQEYPVILPESSTVWDYFLDGENRLWVLFSTKEEFIVERIGASSELQLTELPTIQDKNNWRPYRKIFVDSRERMWVTAGSYPPVITVFQPTWKGNATQIVRYTRGNSNYKEGSSDEPSMMSDGKIWGFDYIITSMDTNQENLPVSLPNWFGNIDWNMLRLYLVPFQFIAIIYQLIQSRKITKQFKQGNQSSA